MNITPQGFALGNGIRMDWHEIHAIVRRMFGLRRNHLALFGF